MQIALFVGCFGQGALFSALFPPGWLFLVFLVPWMIFYGVNFWAVSPFTYKVHLRICFFTLLWWAGLTLLAEALWLAGLMHRFDRAQVVFGQITMNVGWLSFIPVWLMYKRGDPASDADQAGLPRHSE